MLLLSERNAISTLDRHASVGITHEQDHPAIESYRDWLREQVP